MHTIGFGWCADQNSNMSWLRLRLHWQIVGASPCVGDVSFDGIVSPLASSCLLVCTMLAFEHRYCTISCERGTGHSHLAPPEAPMAPERGQLTDVIVLHVCVPSACDAHGSSRVAHTLRLVTPPCFQEEVCPRQAISVGASSAGPSVQTRLPQWPASFSKNTGPYGGWA